MISKKNVFAKLWKHHHITSSNKEEASTKAQQPNPTNQPNSKSNLCCFYQQPKTTNKQTSKQIAAIKTSNMSMKIPKHILKQLAGMSEAQVNDHIQTLQGVIDDIYTEKAGVYNQTNLFKYVIIVVALAYRFWKIWQNNFFLTSKTHQKFLFFQLFHI